MSTKPLYKFGVVLLLHYYNKLPFLADDRLSLILLSCDSKIWCTSSGIKASDEMCMKNEGEEFLETKILDSLITC